MKAWFLSRAPREKILVLAFVLIGALIWLSAAWERASTNRRLWRAAGSDLAAQQLWLDNGETIEAASRQAIQNLDAERTYDATALGAEIVELGKRANLQVNTEPPRTQRTNQFAFHTVQVTSRRADLAAIINFYGLLAERAPYLGLEELTLESTTNAPGMLNISMRVASVELVK